MCSNATTAIHTIDIASSVVVQAVQHQCSQCWNWPKRTGGGEVGCQNVWNFAKGLKFKANFHSKMRL